MQFYVDVTKKQRFYSKIAFKLSLKGIIGDSKSAIRWFKTPKGFKTPKLNPNWWVNRNKDK